MKAQQYIEFRYNQEEAKDRGKEKSSHKHGNRAQIKQDVPDADSKASILSITSESWSDGATTMDYEKDSSSICSLSPVEGS